MGTCKIWKECNNLKTVINYVSNKDKVNLDTYIELHKELNYIPNDLKTNRHKDRFKKQILWSNRNDKKIFAKPKKL